MKTEELLQLIALPEGPTLEFKQEFYALDDLNSEKGKRQKDELLKDLLALANGSIETAGEIAYLIIGVSDLADSTGRRAVIGTPGNLPAANDLLQMVRAASDPPIAHILTEYIPVEDKQVYVITIPPSPYLHETKRRFTPANGEYSPYVVFIRRNSMVDLASMRERKALEDLKAFRARQRGNLSNVLVGSLVGAILLGPVIGKNADKITGRPINRFSGWATGLSIGVLLGGMAGYNIKSLHEEIQNIRFKLMRLKKIR